MDKHKKRKENEKPTKTHLGTNRTPGNHPDPAAKNPHAADPTEEVAAAVGPIHPRHRNRPTPTYQQIPEMVQRVRESDAHPSTKGLSEPIAQTATRHGEAQGIRWEEIDHDQAQIRIPSSRTKSNRPRLVPQSDPAVPVLAQARERTGGTGLVFPSATRQPIPDKVAELALGHTHPASNGLLEQWERYLTEISGPDQTNPQPKTTARQKKETTNTKAPHQHKTQTPNQRKEEGNHPNMGKRKEKKENRTLGKTQVDRVRTLGYHPDSVVDELKLRVQETASGIAKSWVLRVEIDGQDTHLGLGPYPAVSQEEARRRAWAAQDEIAAKRDPRRRNDPTVLEVADKIMAERSSSEKIWASESIRRRWLHNTRTHIYPKIGSLRLKDVRPVDIMECVVPLIKRGHSETARQVFSHLRVICKRAVAENLRDDDPTKAVAVALGPIHPRRRNRPMPSLPYQQVSKALQRVRESGAHPSTKGVCLMMAYSGIRQSEARGLLWDEINCDEALIRIPGRRTKSRRPFVVPLSGPMLAVLDDARERTGGTGLVFPAATGRPISPATLGKLLKSLGLPCVPHGWRSSYRTYMSEHGIPDKVAELALGHTHPSVPAGIDLLEQRRQAIEQWGQYLTESNGTDQPDPQPPSGREEGDNRD